MLPTLPPTEHAAPAQGTDNDDRLRREVRRLSRPHKSGGKVIERAAILAAGTDSTAMLAWIVRHDGEPEALAPKAAARGLHDRSGGDARKPLRYVLPPDAFN